MNSEIQLKKINRVARFTLSFILIYHGLIPKILWLDETEKLLIELHSLNISTQLISLAGGVFEVVLGLIIVLLKPNKFIYYFTIILFTLLLADVALVQPQLLIKAFNPVSMNISAIALCVIVLFSSTK